MDETLKIVAIIALCSLSILIVFGFVFISKTMNVLSDVSKNLDKITENFIVLKNRVMVTLDEVSETQKDLNELKVKAVEQLDNCKVTVAKANDLIDNANKIVGGINNSIEPYEQLINRSYNKIAPPIEKATSFISAISKAIEAFSSRLMSKK